MSLLNTTIPTNHNLKRALPEAQLQQFYKEQWSKSLLDIVQV